jgi:dGTPase
VSQIARTISHALNLNENLTEAISLGHDLGHTPFGHAGEDRLNNLMPEGFHHKEQSLRIIDYLENEGQGLNLTWEVRDGIHRHSKGMGDIISRNNEDMPSTLEGQVVRISDIIAYINHDIDDALRAGIIHQNELPKKVLKILGKSHSSRINNMVTDIIETSLKKELESISLSTHIAEAIIELRKFLYLRVYGNAYSQKEFKKTSKIIEVLFYYFMENPDKIYSYKKPGDNPQRWACDFIAGMTDRYAIRIFQELYIPRPWDRE